MTKKNQKLIVSLVGLITTILISAGIIVAPDKVVVSPGMYKVVKVVDGDTIDVTNGHQTVKIRLIGINTPETVDPRRPVECFGKEASDHAKTLLLNQEVKLEFDQTQDRTDKYGRTLAYVFLHDGRNVNKVMIEEGFAYEYTYENHSYVYQEDFKAAQHYAEVNQRGLWAPGVCTH